MCIPLCIAQGGPTEYRTWGDSRPPSFERAAVNLLIKLLDEDGTPSAPGFVVHIAHLADAGCLPLIKARRGEEREGMRPLQP